MRYIGNKTKIIQKIHEFISENVKEDFTIFCDLFSGTGSVGASYSSTKKIIACDVLFSSYVLTKGYINLKEDPQFKKLGFDPFVYFNNRKNLNNTKKGFIYKNFAPEISGRMYFSNENSKKIDFIRSKIELWFSENKITEQEYYYLLACLLESVSRVANVAGVYGSFLKKWDPRALKSLIIKKLDVKDFAIHNNEIYNTDSLNLLEKITGDVLYIDPPYTENDYAIQYHVLETISKYDHPILKGITGSRPDTKKSVFSKKSSAYVAFEKIISEAKFKYIVISYSNKGLIEKEFIEKVLLKYGKKNTYKHKIISHRKYTNTKSNEDESVEEYLFFVEKSSLPILIESPLNYMGSKFGILEDIIDFSKNNFNVVVDVFGGGFNVGINLKSSKIIYNDLNHFVKELVELFRETKTDVLISDILRRIEKYGLKKSDKTAFVSLRKKYNSDINKKDLVDLYVLLLYGFQQQFRFNSKHEFNNTVGMSNFNYNTLIKILQFSREIKKREVVFHSKDFEDLEIGHNNKKLYYCDPPYLITLGSYNDGKRGFLGWGKEEEIRLYRWLDKLNSRGDFFVLSNVVKHGDKTNEILLDWLKRSSYDSREIKHKDRTELLIKNY